MPKTPEPKIPAPKTPAKKTSSRSKAQIADHMLASRVAASLNPQNPPPAADPGKTVSAAPKPASASSISQKPAAAAPAPTAAAPAVSSDLFGAGVERLTDALSSVQALARETAQSMVDTRLNAAHSLVALQQKMLSMVHANLNEGFALAHKLVAVPNIGEAIKVQTSFAQEAVKAWNAQAAELRDLSKELAKEAGAPWQAHMAKRLKQFREGLGT